ncbi:hypothetical protein STAN_5742 [Streptomyces sp. CBMAI 2042]|nr:hypothetical protein STAN_5742 [Streptomyces sp. CBMAI 2042]
MGSAGQSLSATGNVEVQGTNSASADSIWSGTNGSLA